MEIIKSKTDGINIANDEVLLDIETTGLASKYSGIYMVGIIYSENNEIKFEQWFAEKKEDEYEILYRLFEVIENKKIITYNGDSFDLPFIKSRGKIYGINYPIYHSIDLIKPTRKIKKILELENVKLKTVEAYFGFARDDVFTGGMLIDIYHSYLESKDEKLKHVLLLHNNDDMLGLYKLYKQKDFILSIKSMIDGTYEAELKSFIIEHDNFHVVFNTNFISDKKIQGNIISLTFSDNTCEASGKIIKGTLKHFFKDHYNYYYSADDDMAIHKSVGKYLKNANITKAKKENCYIKEDGIFLPSSKNLDLPLFKREFDSTELYVSLSDIKKQNMIHEYINTLLSML